MIIHRIFFFEIEDCYKLEKKDTSQSPHGFLLQPSKRRCQLEVQLDIPISGPLQKVLGENS